jgi:hypothetical protein
MTIEVIWPPHAAIDRFDAVKLEYVLSDAPGERWSEYFYYALTLGANVTVRVDANSLEVVGVTSFSAWSVMSSINAAIDAANSQRDEEVERARLERDAVEDIILSVDGR